MKTHVCFAVIPLFLAGCEPPGSTESGGGGGSTSTSPETGGGGNAGSGGAIPWDGSPSLGIGYDGAPCTGEHARFRAGKSPAWSTSLEIVIPVDGFVTGATVVHTLADALGGCAASPRRVLVSAPTTPGKPLSPGVWEALTWTAAEESEAPAYPFNDTHVAKPVMLSRDLAEVMPVHAGDVVHLASVLDDPTECAVMCDEIDGAAPKPGSFLCGDAEGWNGCAPLDDRSVLAWLDFAAK